MSRLIDADKLIEVLSDIEDEYKATLNENCNDDPFSNGILSALFQVFKTIKEQPTAYDVDKVVKELELFKNVELSKRDSLVEEELEKIEDCNDCDDWYEAGHFEGSVTASVNTYLKAIEIVKAGGRDD